MRAFDNFYLPVWLRNFFLINLKEPKSYYDNSFAVFYSANSSQLQGKFRDKVKEELKANPLQRIRTSFHLRKRFIHSDPYWLGTNQLIGALSPLGKIWQDFKRAFRRSDSPRDMDVEATQIFRGFFNVGMAIVVAMVGLVLLPYDTFLLPFRLLAAPMRGVKKANSYMNDDHSSNVQLMKSSRWQNITAYCDEAIAAVWRDVSYLIFSLSLVVRGVTQIVAAPLVIFLQWPFQRFLRACHGGGYRSFVDKSSTKKYVKEMNYHLEQMAVSLLDEKQQKTYKKSNTYKKIDILKTKLIAINQTCEKSDFKTLLQNYNDRPKSFWTKTMYPHRFEDLFFELESKTDKAARRGQAINNYFKPNIKMADDALEDYSLNRNVFLLYKTVNKAEDNSTVLSENSQAILSMIENWRKKAEDIDSDKQTAVIDVLKATFA